MRQDIFALEPRTRVEANSYITSYRHLLSYFAPKDIFDAADVVRGAHMAYAWMPTILEFYPSPPDLDLHHAAKLLTRAKRDGTLTDEEIGSLARLINNSVIGASKLLHFAAPDSFAIWDSKIYAFVFDKRPHNKQVNQVKNFRLYLNKLAELRADLRFEAFHKSINKKVGYSVSPLRALELIMFLNKPDLEPPELADIPS